MKTHICQNCNCDERKNLMDGVEFKEALPWHEIKKISFCKKDLRIIIELDNGNSMIGNIKSESYFDNSIKVATLKLNNNQIEFN